MQALHKLFHSRTKDELAIATYAEGAHRHIRNDDRLLEQLRAPIPDFGMESLRAGGVDFVWQFTQLTRARLTELCGDKAFAMRRTFAQRGLLIDTVFTEEQMRVILERPANLFAVEGMETLLFARIVDTPEIVNAFDAAGVTADVRTMITKRLAEHRLPFTLLNAAVHWPVVTSGIMGAYATHVQTALARLGLWAPLVWTSEERTRWHTMEYDRVRLVAFQAQE